MTQAREAAAQPVSLLRGWVSACAIFSGFVILALAGSLFIAWLLGGNRFFSGAAVGWALCWGAAFFSLILVLLGKQLGQGLGAVLFAMMFRMILPLAAAMYLVNQSPFWVDAFLLPFLLGNYFLALFAETGLAVHLLGGTSPLVKKPLAPAGDATASELAGKLTP
ncbi:hypothetical protein ETAA8_38140 [Anatilimnocola aggregata]|uniref:ATP synthase protein I n=1 Tax=Anatilimnocola aggregata TaxID=2528021 RepID=A0A517YER4_9BACT|nr:hypothetical protein [Anatilimnocola aggregata]QDU28709.1 hypothetical protein ETAA8_38140 [Anatilimnocola aggregata]